jgi:hypothetical protein
MTRWIACLSMTLAAVSALAEQAQASDTDYCRALARTYETYIANMASGRSPMPESPDVKIAKDHCDKGDTAAGIPVLEQKLRNAKINLPPRS